MEYNTRKPRIRVQLCRINGRLGAWEFVFTYAKHNLERRYPYEEIEEVTTKIVQRKSFVFKSQNKRVDLDDIELQELISAIRGYIYRRDKVKCVSPTQIILREYSQLLEYDKLTVIQSNHQYFPKVF